MTRASWHLTSPSDLEEAGVALVTIHGAHHGNAIYRAARLDGIAAVVAAVKKIPVIGNGDVKTPEDARRMIDITKCAGIMIGRGALAGHGFCGDMWSYLTTGKVPEQPTIPEKCDMIRQHFYNLVKYRDERIAVLEMRKRISWYAKSMNPCRMLRDDIREINQCADFDRVVNNFLDWRGRYEEGVRAGRIKPILEEAAVEAA